MNSEQNTPQPDPNAETQRFDTTPVPADAAAAADAGAPPAPAAPASPEAPAAEPVASASVADEQAGKKRRRRNILIGAAAAVALLAVGGGAYAVGASVADDDDDDRPGISDGDRPGGGADRDDRDDDRRGDDRGGDDAPGQASGAAPAADAASLRAAAEAAIAEADGTGVTSIDLEDAGYEVEVLLADGQEVDVFVTADGTATAAPDQDDPRSDPALDLAQLDAIIEAAFAAAEAEGVTGGAIESVSSSSDQGVAYEVSIRYDRGGDADIDLASDLSLVSADIDD